MKVGDRVIVISEAKEGEIVETPIEYQRRYLYHAVQVDKLILITCVPIEDLVPATPIARLLYL